MTVAEPRTPAWGFSDAALLIGAILPSLLLGAVVVRMGRMMVPDAFSSKAMQTIAYQIGFYALMLAALYFVISVKHQQPFWESLNWTLRFRGAWTCLLVAPFLTIGISALGTALRTPLIRNPFEELIDGTASRLAVMLLATVIAPFWEELMFRGFLFPLVERIAGPWPAIFASAALFGLIHLAQYEWLWQYGVLVALSGVMFGYARYKTGSTAASTLMHSAYNTTLFLVFLIQRA